MERKPTKLRPSSEAEPITIFTEDKSIRDLVYAIGEEHLSVKEMMTKIGLKHRNNFMTNYLEPAISEGYVDRLYPDKPQHPRQKYFLTVKGKALLVELS